MAPKVCVPADFGRHHIGVPSHGNLTFNLAEGVQIKANSIILSLNSPVIDDLTTDLQLTSLDAEDFTREAVDCFIEASYTGETEMLNKTNFRDVNKMSHVFKVSWLTARCKNFFACYLDQLESESSYADLLFAVEEAVYLMSAVKERNFLDLVVQKMCEISTVKRDSFIAEYLADFTFASNHKIDACISIVGFEIHVLIEFLVDHLDQSGKKSLDDSSRYLLSKADLNLCFHQKPEVHTKLFTLVSSLSESTRQDLQLFVSLCKQNTSKPKEMVAVEKCLVPVLKHGPFSDYLSRTDEDNAYSFQEDFDILAARKDLKNLYSFIDGLWCRLDNIQCSDLTSIGALQKIIGIKNKNGWGKMCKNYLIDFRADVEDYTKPLVDMVSNCDQLVDNSHDVACTVIFEYSSAADFTTELFCRNNHFEFKLPGKKFADQKYVLLTTSMKENEPFQMKWGLLHSAGNTSYVDTLPNLHFALQRLKDNAVWEILPISWCDQPSCDETKTFWNWGYISFHNKSVGKMKEIKLIGEGSVNWKYYTDTVDEKLRFVAFTVDND